MIRLLPILLIGLLTACGQKGALYLPPATTDNPLPPAAAQQAPATPEQPASPPAGTR